MIAKKLKHEAVPTYVPHRLEYLRGELRAERISTGELVELQSLVQYIAPGDVELLEAAGVPEDAPAQSGQHTGKPWVCHWDAVNQRWLLRRGSGVTFGHFCGWSKDGVTAEEEDAANIQFIVQACNCHEELLAACKAAFKEYCQMGCECPTETTGHRSGCVVGMLDDAIAKAQGGAK